MHVISQKYVIASKVHYFQGFIINFMCPIDDVKPVKNAINPAALTPETAAKMLGLQVEIVQKHIARCAYGGRRNYQSYFLCSLVKQQRKLWQLT
jgi:hypothetical protein